VKVQQSTHLINPFGGIQFVLEQLKDAGIHRFINEQLGSRGEAKTYSIAGWAVVHTL
jgi:hypothetical protein